MKPIRKMEAVIDWMIPYTGVCGFFLSVKFATSLLASLAGGIKL